MPTQEQAEYFTELLDDNSFSDLVAELERKTFYNGRTAFVVELVENKPCFSAVDTVTQVVKEYGRIKYAEVQKIQRSMNGGRYYIEETMTPEKTTRTIRKDKNEKYSTSTTEISAETFQSETGIMIEAE